MMNRWSTDKKNIERFVEKNNGYIQLVFLLITLIIGVICKALNIQEEQSITIELLLLISAELILLSIKDSIAQDKLNRLIYNNDKIHGMILAETREGYRKFPEMLSHAEKDMFISGIASNGIWSYITTLEELLQKGGHMRILISAEDAVESNTRLYKGLGSEKNIESYIQEVKSKINVTFSSLRNSESLKKYFLNNQIEIRRSSVPFSTAYVGINVFSESIHQELKVTHYVEGCSTDNCPNIIINPLDNSYWYGYYIEQLKRLWKEAIPIEKSDIYEQTHF